MKLVVLQLGQSSQVGRTPRDLQLVTGIRKRDERSPKPIVKADCQRKIAFGCQRVVVADRRLNLPNGSHRNICGLQKLLIELMSQRGGERNIVVSPHAADTIFDSAPEQE
jgi:hypothetical protein